MANRDDDKRLAAHAALEQIEPGWTVGVGTGSTANLFIDGLGDMARDVAGAVASSEASAERLRRVGIPLVELAEVERLPIYVDGADEATRRGELIKGGGGALTREKIVAEASERHQVFDMGSLVRLTAGRGGQLACDLVIWVGMFGSLVGCLLACGDALAAVVVQARGLLLAPDPPSLGDLGALVGRAPAGDALGQRAAGGADLAPDGDVDAVELAEVHAVEVDLDEGLLGGDAGVVAE